MTPELNGCGMIMHARCALTNWPEARAVPLDNMKAVAHWIFEDIQCRWGTVELFVTDNAGQFAAALDWLSKSEVSRSLHTIHKQMVKLRNIIGIFIRCCIRQQVAICLSGIGSSIQLSGQYQEESRLFTIFHDNRCSSIDTTGLN